MFIFNDFLATVLSDLKIVRGFYANEILLLQDRKGRVYAAAPILSRLLCIRSSFTLLHISSIKCYEGRARSYKYWCARCASDYIFTENVPTGVTDSPVNDGRFTMLENLVNE